MRVALVSSAIALGIGSLAFGGCSHTHDRTVQSRSYEPSAAEQRRIDERRAEERKAEDRRAEERRLAEEQRLSEIRDQERRLADERRAVEERRADDRRIIERRDGRVRPIGGGPNEPELRATAGSAVASIAGARCDREVRCKHIGAKEKFQTRAACVAEMQRDKRDDLNSDVCTGGIREKELTDCLKSIRDEDCGNPLDTIARLNACRSSNLCVK